MKFNNTEVWGFKHAMRGMRNPLESWDKSSSTDSYICENDIKLGQRLIRGGSEHRKFLRQIMISVDITAPLYWFKEFDTYKINTTANSTSTMHKLATTPITLDCFEIDDYDGDLVAELLPMNNISDIFIQRLELIRKTYLGTKDKRYWKELIRWLPASWLQTRTITMNYENLRNMYFQRRNHKLSEWSVSFVEWIRALPYASEFITYEGGE